MSPELIGIIGLAILLVLIAFGVYISISMAIVGIIGTLFIGGVSVTISNLFLVPWGIIGDFNYAVLPLFILMGEFISAGGIASEAFRAARAWIGHVRGGLAMAAIGACGLFAATSGSSIACAIVMGKVAYPEMMKYKYSPELAAGCIAAGGSTGIMIPPSMAFVIIGIITGTSIGKLFIAGILPGITQILFYFFTIVILCRINPNLGPSSPNIPFKEKVTSLTSTWPIIVLFLLVMGGLYMGVFTPSESAAVGAFGALIIGISRRQLPWSHLWSSLNETVKVVGMLLLLLVSAYFLNRFMAISRIPFVASDFINGLGLNRYLILVFILVLYIILGCFFDIMAILILTLPILFPVVTSMKFDPVWFGVLMCRVAEMGFITPPFGLNLFGLSGACGIPLGTLFKGIMPFVVTDFFHLILLVGVPSIALILPSIMK